MLLKYQNDTSNIYKNYQNLLQIAIVIVENKVEHFFIAYVIIRKTFMTGDVSVMTSSSH